MEKETKIGLKVLGGLTLVGLAIWGIAKAAKAAPPLADYRVAIGFYDPTIPKYVLGTIIVDGVRHDIAPPYYWWEDILSEGIHSLDIIVPLGYEFDEVAVGDEETHEVIYTIDELPASIEIDRDIGIRVVIRPIAMLFGIVTDTTTGNPIAGVTIIFNGKETYTNAAGEYAIIDFEVGSLVLAFSHIDYEAYQVEITLSLGENRLDVSLTPAIIGEIFLTEGYNMVTYTGREQTVNDAFASIAGYVARVYHFVDSEYYEDICRSPVGCTKMMIPGNNYWVAVTQYCIWTF